MQYYVIQPPPEISCYVRNFWVLEGSVSKHEPFIHRVLADCCPEFIFYYKGAFQRINLNNRAENCLQSGIYGQTRLHTQYLVNEDFGIFGTYLYPYTITQLFNRPASELSDQYPDLKSLCGKEGEILEEKVVLAADNISELNLSPSF